MLRGMPIRAVSFDLFDTLVDLEMENLPRVVVRGRELRSTVGELYEEAREETELEFDAFAQALMELDKAQRQPAHYDYREFPTLYRFELLCERIGITTAGLPQRLTDVHMGLVAERAKLPEGCPAGE